MQLVSSVQVSEGEVACKSSRLPRKRQARCTEQGKGEKKHGRAPDGRPNTNGVEARAVLRCGKGCADNMRGGEVHDAGGGVDAAVACANSVLLVAAAG